jgi:hypothetical protein
MNAPYGEQAWLRGERIKNFVSDDEAEVKQIHKRHLKL